MQFVDEQDDVSVCGGDFLQDGFQAFLEFTAVFRACNQRAHVKSDNPFVLQGFRHVAAHDTRREPLHDGSLSDTGFTDEDRVVLGPAGEDLDCPADLVVAPDHRIQLVLAGGLGQIASIFLQRLE